ncbi:MAG: YvcK family protein [Magnetococcales bacterium]|nr:YvcK family protein [Magnetococcales bacterium]
MGSEKQIAVVLFSGGRGTASLSPALIRHSQIHLTVIVNAYDDGLSTGRLRGFIPGMLGPSDVRKNISTLMPVTESCHGALKRFLDFRFPDGTSREQALGSLVPVAKGMGFPSDPFLAEACRDLTMGQMAVMGDYCRAFLAYEEARLKEGISFDYGDCSVGNILFSGCYLAEGKNFNQAIDHFAQFSACRGRVLNITDGANRVLVALKADGRFLVDESAIVAPQDSVSIQEIFLLPDYLTPEELKQLGALPPEARRAFLATRESLPKADAGAIEAIADADLIIYGPGTQHSSLLPSYLTQGMTEAITGNETAEKVFVANILHDHDIPNLSVQGLLQAFHYYMSRKGAIDCQMASLTTRVLVQEPDQGELNRERSGSYVPFDIGRMGLDPEAVTAGDWEMGSGRHHGGQLVDQLLPLAQRLVEVKIHPYRHMVSIVVPALNEAATIGRVLEDLNRLDLSGYDVAKELIVVDGGSSDETLAIAREEKFVRVYVLEAGRQGRGEAIRMGLAKARGNVVVIFPSDGEYQAGDLALVVEPIIQNRYRVVFGSRAIKCVNLSQRIRHIYGNRRLAHFLSKYGGMSISILSLLLYNRYVSDPFSTLKGFDRALLRSMNLVSSGVDLEGEIIAKVSRLGEFVLEVPVQYHPRTKAEGKKTTVGDGFSTLFSLIRHGFWKPNE